MKIKPTGTRGENQAGTPISNTGEKQTDTPISNQEGNETNGKPRRTTRALAERRLQVDQARLENLALAGLSDEQIAATLKVPVASLRQHYGEQIEQARLRGLGMLWRKAFELAMVQSSEKMTTFLLGKRDALETDPQVLELRALEIRERRIRVEQMENEERERARLARELQRIQVARGQLALRSQQQLALGSQRQEQFANLDNMTEQEIATVLNDVQMQLNIYQMDEKQRRQLVQALPQVSGQPLILSGNAAAQFQDVLLWLCALNAEEQQRILLSLGIDLHKEQQS